jgi:hypothetical protein
MLKAQLEAEIVQANERITKTREGNFDPHYKKQWIEANEKHIAVCEDELAGLEKLTNRYQQS